MMQKVIVLVEDSAADARVVTRAIDQLGDPSISVIHYETAETAMHYFDTDGANHADLKKIVLVDLNLPGADGFRFLRHIKGSPAHKHIPVIVWTTSDQPRDIRHSYASGANSFVTKPMGLSDVTELIKDVCHYWFDRATLA
ncbi:MAG: response regulator [Rhodospirillales bacterium]|nr:response regulator [Rhodospirillales bacterium]